MGELSISELARRTGLASSTLRFYERKGVLGATRRIAGKRIYDESAIERVASISLLKRAGFTLSEIAELTGPTGRTPPNWRPIAQAKLRELDDRVQEIKQAQAALLKAIGSSRDHLDDCPVHHRILRAHAKALATAANDAHRPSEDRRAEWD